MANGWVRRCPSPGPFSRLTSPFKSPSDSKWLQVCPDSEEERYARYLPRNLSHCNLCLDALKDHIARKMILLEQSLADLGEPLTTGHLDSESAETSAWLSGDSAEESSSVFASEDLLTKNPSSRRDRSPSSSILRKERSKSFPPPNRRSAKKVVRFADSLGLELETVRHLIFSELPPYIPSRVLPDLHQFPASMELEPRFTNPSSKPDFNERLKAEGVLLHSIRCYYTSIYGLVSVMNLTYHKKVTVRYSVNGWKSHCETRATYVPRPDTASKETDQFRFTIFASPKEFYGKEMNLSFAICFKTEDGQERWDNNGGLNYSLIGRNKASPNENNNGRTWVHFI